MPPDFGCARALLLQGPAGPFFHRFGRELRDAGVVVTKVNFHGGDRLFYPGPGAIDYAGTREAWPAFVRELMRDRGADAVFLFGDCRPHHAAAIEVARDLDVAVWVFEEGYLRPDYVTLEAHGVNGNSRLPRDPVFYQAHAPKTNGTPTDPAVKSWEASAWYSALNAWAFTYKNGDFPHYEHHRDLDMWKHTGWHVRGGLRKVWFGLRERGLLEEITERHDGRYFLVPLQCHGDFQLVHSPFDGIPEFVEHVVREFAQHGRPEDVIVFKHHPMDRPYAEWDALHRELAARHGLGDRLYYVHDLHLPTLLRHARGTVTINSTVGLSSIHHGTPVKVLGDAIYDIAGLTHQGELREFLARPGRVDAELYGAFRAYLEEHNQANGSFYVRLAGRDTPTGIRWFRGARRD